MKRTKIQNDQKIMLEDEIYENAIIPSQRSEMWRDVDLAGEVCLNGGIFGEHLSVNARFVFVRDAVFCRKDAELTGSSSKSKTWFNSVVTAGHSILTRNPKARTRFSSDVKAKILNLSNTIVYGNVFCDEIELEDSIILGGVYAAKNLKVKDSIVGTFQTARLAMKGNLAILFPFSITEGDAKIEGRLYNLLAPPFKEKRTGIFEMDEKDVFTLSLEDSESKRSTVRIISPSFRIFDLTEYQNIIRENLERIHEILEYHDKQVQKKDRELDEFEQLLFSVIENQFKTKAQIPASRFMDIEEETLKEFPRLENFLDFPESGRAAHTNPVEAPPQAAAAHEQEGDAAEERPLGDETMTEKAAGTDHADEDPIAAESGAGKETAEKPNIPCLACANFDITFSTCSVFDENVGTDWSVFLKRCNGVHFRSAGLDNLTESP